MTITRMGATKKYADGWETAFGDKKRGARKAATASVAKRTTPKKKTTMKAAKKKPK